MHYLFSLSYLHSLNPGLSGRFFVTALPTIYHVSNGEFRKYSGSRDMNAFMTFIEEKKWTNIDTLTGWKRPDGIPMSILSWFFRLSHFLKVIFILYLLQFYHYQWYFAGTQYNTLH